MPIDNDDQLHLRSPLSRNSKNLMDPNPRNPSRDPPVNGYLHFTLTHDLETRTYSIAEAENRYPGSQGLTEHELILRLLQIVSDPERVAGKVLAYPRNFGFRRLMELGQKYDDFEVVFYKPK